MPDHHRGIALGCYATAENLHKKKERPQNSLSKGEMIRQGQANKSTSISHLSLLRSKKRKEHVERNLDSVDVWNAPLVGNELEVDHVHNRPHLPRSLACSKQVILDLISDDGEGISVDETEIGEEHTHEDGAPEELIDGNFRENGDGIGSGDLLFKPVVEGVTRGAMVDESEEGESGEAFVVDGTSSDEDLTSFDGLMTN